MLDFNRDMMSYQGAALNCKVTLQHDDLWKQFHELETEMIITKSGRRIFPSLRVQVEHLDPNAQYCVLVEMVPVSKCRYKYSASGGWAPAGAEEAQSPNRIYLHPESPASGHHWMSQAINFNRIKLTNTANPPPGHLVLSSMHRYQPRIIIAQTSDPRKIPWALHTSVSFQETQFIAVTAYQNDKITKLKINNNPFAKGFRENGQSKCKRKRQQKEEEIEIDVENEVDDIKQESKRVPSEASLSPRLDSSYASSERTSSPETYQYASPVVPMHHQYPMHYQYPRYSHLVPSLGNYNPYYYPQLNVYPSSYLSPYYNNPFSIPPMVQEVRVPREEIPKKLTDFSIKAITGLS